MRELIGFPRMLCDRSHLDEAPSTIESGFHALSSGRQTSSLHAVGSRLGWSGDVMRSYDVTSVCLPSVRWISAWMFTGNCTSSHSVVMSPSVTYLTS